jgi:hypothetical protein
VVRCVLDGGSAALISYRGIDLLKRRLILRFAPLNEHPFLAIWAFHRCSFARLSIIAIMIMLASCPAAMRCMSRPRARSTAVVRCGEKPEQLRRFTREVLGTPTLTDTARPYAEWAF